VADEHASALRDLLARIDAALDQAEPREVASLSREKRQLLTELDKLAGTEKGSPVDELNRRREERRAASATPPRAKRGRK